MSRVLHAAHYSDIITPVLKLRIHKIGTYGEWMTHWDKTKFFERESNIYSFSQNPLLKKNQNIHLYMPWDQSSENEMMFKIKEVISGSGKAVIPYMEKTGSSASLPIEVMTKINAQLEDGRETHLIMSNLESIHVFRVSKILAKKDLKKSKNKPLVFYGKSNSAYNTWVQVDDLFVLDANHDGNASAISNQLDNFVYKAQTQNIFKPILNPIVLDEKEDTECNRDRWVDMNRSLTYDYFIRSCELKDNIFQDAWKYLSRKTQHQLISSELGRYNAIFYRDQEKWGYLKSSFHAYLQAIYSELNSVYIFPLLNAITTYESFREAWKELDKGLVNPKIQNMIEELLSGKKKQINSLEDFLYYTKNAKSLLFTLKQKFTKKIHKEEFLLVENFLCRQESLVESFNCSPLVEKLESVIKINKWIMETDLEVSQLSNSLVKDCNLKLSHLLSILVSASYQDNIFFRLIEEKAAKGLVQKSFDDVVKNLLNIDVKKSA